MTRPRLAGDALAARYPAFYASWRTRSRYGDVRGAVLARLPPYGRFRRRPGRMLDVGLGRGDLAAAFMRSGWSVAGLDTSARAVSIAAGRGIDARTGALDAPPWPPGSFDLVVLSHVLEHVDDPVADLRAARTLLAPHGAAIVAVPAWDSPQRLAFGSAWNLADLPRHLQHFTVPSLHRAAAAAGFASGRARRYTSMSGAPLSIWNALAGAWAPCPSARAGVVLAGVACHPAVWLAGRALGPDCIYLELRPGHSSG